MGFRDTLARAFQPIPMEEHVNGRETKAVGSPEFVWQQGVGFWDRFSTPDKDSVTRQTAYAATALAYICIRYRQRKLAEPPLMVVDETAEGEPWVEGHALAPILARPNPDYGMRRLYGLTSVFRDISGHVLWLKIRGNGGRTERLYPFDGDSFRVESTDDRQFGRFLVNTKQGEREFGPDDVVFFPGLDPFNPHGAVSPLDAALHSLGLGEQVRVAARNTLRNSMNPSGVLEIPGQIGRPEFEEILAQVDISYSGSRNSGKPFVATGGARWTTIARTMGELLPDKLWSVVEANVCACFGVRPEIVGVLVGLQNAPWSHMETARKLFYEEVALPQWADDEEILTESLLREIDTDPTHLVRFDTSRIPALQEDVKQKAEIAQKLGPWLRTDEVRQAIGYEPLGGPEGDTRWVPSTWMPAALLESGGIEGAPPIDNNRETEEEDE